MPVVVDWSDIALRLAGALLAGTALGLDRTERGKTVGLRTTLLVTLAAALSMIQANLLLPTAGKPSDSFVAVDVMRLPLGLLTGMGFIGAGAILRKGGRVTGVTTAATLWLATILGLCFGGGQHGLGAAGLGLGMVVLWILKRLESALPQKRRGLLSIRCRAGGLADDDILNAVHAEHGRATGWSAIYSGKDNAAFRRVSCEVRIPDRPGSPSIPEFVGRFAALPGVEEVRWRHM